MNTIKNIFKVFTTTVGLLIFATVLTYAQGNNQLFPTTLNNNPPASLGGAPYPGINATNGTNMNINWFPALSTNILSYSGNVTNVTASNVVNGLPGYSGCLIINKGRSMCLSYTAALVGANTGSDFQVLNFDSTSDLAHYQTNAFVWTVGPFINSTNGPTTFVTNLTKTQVSSCLALGLSSTLNTNAQIITNATLNAYLDAQP